MTRSAVINAGGGGGSSARGGPGERADERVVRGLIDGRPVEAPWGATVLEAARAASIPVPTLCRHEGLPPEGGCRLCLVEIGGELVASCLYPLRSDGFDVLTMSPAVRKARAFVIRLLLARAPDSRLVGDLAAEYGVSPDPRLSSIEPDGCLRCGRCVRACAAAGAEAIGLAGRGPARKVTGPFHEPPADCLGCLACARVCPTGAIAFEDGPRRRRIWGRDFELAACPVCGRPWATAAELAFRGSGLQGAEAAPAEAVPTEAAPVEAGRAVPGGDPPGKPVPAEGAVCPDCRRRAMAEAVAAAPRPDPDGPLL